MTLRPSLLALALAAVLPAVAHADRGFEVRDLAKLDRVSAPVLSPDGRKVVFAKRVVDFAANKARPRCGSKTCSRATPRRRCASRRKAGTSIRRRSPTTARRVYFLSAKSGSMQLYAIPVAGGAPVQLTDLAVDVGGYKLSPDGKRVALGARSVRRLQGATCACNASAAEERERRKATGVVFDRLFIRHWDTWNEGKLNRVFVAPFATATARRSTQATLVGGDVIGDVPSQPVRRHQRDRLVARRQVARAVARARPTTRNRGRPTSTCTWSTPTAAARREEPHRRQHGLGHRPGVRARRQDAVLPRDEAPGLRGRPLRADGDGPGHRHDARDRTEVGSPPPTASCLSDDGKTIYTTAAGTRASIRCSPSTSPAAKSRRSSGTARSPRSTSPAPTLRLHAQLAEDAAISCSPRSPTAATPRAITHERRRDAARREASASYEQFKFTGWNNETVHGYVVKPWNYSRARSIRSRS